MLYPAARLPAGTMYSIRNRKLSAGIFPKAVPAPFPAAFPGVGTLFTASGQLGPKCVMAILPLSAVFLSDGNSLVYVHR